VYSAVRQYTVRGMALTSASLVFWGVPAFVPGPLLLWLFSLKLGWLPFVGSGFPEEERRRETAEAGPTPRGGSPGLSRRHAAP
jgi:ABC-type dipeptide/oligopeptide/nickel transport system permease component